MYQRTVPCEVSGCCEPAVYKIAASWSDGRHVELKTFGLCCRDHLRPVFRGAEERQKGYKLPPDETVEAVGIYRYETGRPDRRLQRLWELEKNYRT